MSIDAKTIAAGGLAAGLLLGAWGLVVDDDAGPAPTSEVGVLTEPDRTGMLSAAAAVAFWQARVDARPAGFLDRTHLGMALARQARQDADLDRYAEAEVTLRDAVAANPGYLDAELALGQVLHAQHDFDAAHRIATDVWLAESTSQQAIALVGDTSLELGDLDRAAEFYARLAALDRSAPAVSRLARLAYAQGRPDEALDLAAEALRSSDRLPLSADDAAFYWFQLGHTQFATGRVDDAVTSLETALDVAPGHAGATEKLAGVYAAIGRLDDAERLYRTLLAAGGAADLHGAYADLLRARGADEPAGEHERLGAALAVDAIERYPAERRHLVDFFLTRDPQIAVDLALADLGERKDAGAYDTAAWALYHADRADEAGPLMARALATGIEDAAVFAHAGFIAAAIGDDDAARRHLAAALAINDRFDVDEAPAARTLLETLG